MIDKTIKTFRAMGPGKYMTLLGSILVLGGAIGGYGDFTVIGENELMVFGAGVIFILIGSYMTWKSRQK